MGFFLFLNFLNWTKFSIFLKKTFKILTSQKWGGQKKNKKNLMVGNLVLKGHYLPHTQHS